MSMFLIQNGYLNGLKENPPSLSPPHYMEESIHRGSYMSAHVLLNLLNELGKRDKMRGLPSILSLFRNEFDKFNNTRARMLDSIYHMTNTLKSHFWRKKRYDFVIMYATLFWTS